MIIFNNNIYLLLYKTIFIYLEKNNDLIKKLKR